jgi:hypothetical protein
MKLLIWIFLIVGIYGSLARADHWVSNETMDHSPSPNFEQYAAYEPSAEDQHMSVARLKPLDEKPFGEKNFKNLGVSILKQSSWIGGRGSYSWPMPTENTSLGVYGGYARDKEKNTKLGIGIESISYFGEEEQSGFFLKGVVGVGHSLYSEKVASNETTNVKKSKKQTRSKGQAKESNKGDDFLNFETGIGYNIKFEKLNSLYFSICIRKELAANTSKFVAGFETGLLW